MLWLRSQLIDYLILDFALAIENVYGRPVFWATVGNHLRENQVNISSFEQLETLKGLRHEGHLRLIKWYDDFGFAEFSGYEDDDFFFRGEFRLLATRQGRQHHAQLRDRLFLAAPVHNRKIGFHASNPDVK